jgi:hypothetical protein
MNSGNGPIGSLIVGIMLIVLGVVNLMGGFPDAIQDTLSNLDFATKIRSPRPPLVDFADLLLVPIGIIMIVMSIIAIRHGKGKPKYTEEDVVKAKAALDRMYFREHGRWPEEEEEGKKDA